MQAEKLSESNGIHIGNETPRGWLIEADLWKRRRKSSSHRQWRQRKERFGEMVQMDGSHHDWLEGRGDELLLMGYIDDATGKVFGRFYDYEGTIPAMDSFKRYVKKYGFPMSVYQDRLIAVAKTYKRSYRRLSVPAENHPWRKSLDRNKAPKDWVYAYTFLFCQE